MKNCMKANNVGAETMGHVELEIDIDEIIFFVTKKLNVVFDSDFDTLPLEDKISELKKTLNKPIRVCGMVKNEGEPGGGPEALPRGPGQGAPGADRRL